MVYVSLCSAYRAYIHIYIHAYILPTFGTSDTSLTPAGSAWQTLAAVVAEILLATFFFVPSSQQEVYIKTRTLKQKCEVVWENVKGAEQTVPQPWNRFGVHTYHIRVRPKKQNVGRDEQAKHAKSDKAVTREGNARLLRGYSRGKGRVGQWESGRRTAGRGHAKPPVSSVSPSA